MWYEHPGQVNTAAKSIEMTSPYVRATHSVPGHAGPKVRKVEKGETDQMLEMKVIEPSKSRWDSPFVLTRCVQKVS